MPILNEDHARLLENPVFKYPDSGLETIDDGGVVFE